MHDTAAGLDATLSRLGTSLVPPSATTPSFVIGAENRSYKHQYANIYFVRLRMLRSCVEENAKRRWKTLSGGPTFVPRVLEVEKGQLCFVIGTVYLDMPLKPNVLEDIARDHSIPAPPPRQKFNSEDDNIMLEDESGRINLVGEQIRSAGLVTGVILGALGMEISSGDFEVVDFCFAGMPPQPRISLPDIESMDVDSSPSDSDEWVALVSGLEVGATRPCDAQIQMLVEFLTGELGDSEDQLTSSRISRLIIAGNSIAEVVTTNIAVEDQDQKTRRQAQQQSTFSPHPVSELSESLDDIARSMPIHLLPGPSDPSGTILPQRPLPRAMFGGAAKYSSFSLETNPAFIHVNIDSLTPQQDFKSQEASTSKNASASTSVQSRTILVNSGQPVDDMFKYLPTPPHSRLSMAESTLHWRHMAPTAPDTLWCHPFFSTDPFIITETPDIYVIGNQPEFKTKLVTEKPREQPPTICGSQDEPEKRCRIILVPNFRETGTMVMVNLRTLGVKTMNCALGSMHGG